MIDSLSAGLVLVGVLVAAVFMRLGALEHRLRAFSRLDAKLDALLKHAGIQFDPYREG